MFKLTESSFLPWNAEVLHETTVLEEQLELHIHHVREGRTDQDILFEILLKSGYPLTTPIEAVTIAGKTVHSVAGGQLLICLDRKLTLELIRAMAERNPERVCASGHPFGSHGDLRTFLFAYPPLRSSDVSGGTRARALGSFPDAPKPKEKIALVQAGQAFAAMTAPPWKAYRRVIPFVNPCCRATTDGCCSSMLLTYGTCGG